MVRAVHGPTEAARSRVRVYPAQHRHLLLAGDAVHQTLLLGTDRRVCGQGDGGDEGGGWRGEKGKKPYTGSLWGAQIGGQGIQRGSLRENVFRRRRAHYA